MLKKKGTLIPSWGIAAILTIIGIVVAGRGSQRVGGVLIIIAGLLACYHHLENQKALQIYDQTSEQRYYDIAANF